MDCIYRGNSFIRAGRGELFTGDRNATVATFSLRRLFWTVHQWIGIGLFVLLVPIAVSGALLVYHDEFDALVNPKRWTVSGPELALVAVAIHGAGVGGCRTE